MKQHYSLLALVALTAMMISCNRANNDPEIGHSKFTKITDYLYEITYNGVDESVYESLNEFDQDMMQPAAGCSSVRNGSFHGRNLDLYYSDCAEVVVHMEHGAKHFASIAVCGSLLYTPTIIEHFMTADLFTLLPFVTMDGINENGVVCNVNVVPATDMPKPTGTNPGAPRLFIGAACRYILDHAVSAHHAVELLSQHDLFGDGFGGTFQFHLMISDKDSTMIVELIDNQLTVQANPAHSEKNIMTNYFCNKSELTPHAQGIERANLLREHYEEANSDTKMMDLMEKVKYTKLYREDTNPYWYSDLYGVFEVNGQKYDFNINTPTDIMDSVKALTIADFNKKYPDSRDYSFWQTMHTSVYNMDELRLMLVVQEKYNKSYGFSLK